jgi:hypothetical protein
MLPDNPDSLNARAVLCASCLLREVTAVAFAYVTRMPLAAVS